MNFSSRKGGSSGNNSNNELANGKKPPVADRLKKEFSLEEGAKEIVRRLKDVTERPILICIYGRGGSGKSHLIKELQQHFEKMGLKVIGYMSNPDPAHFEKKIFLENKGITIDVFMFHCSWNFMTPQDPEDPNYLAQSILNRKINLNVGIYNPKLGVKPEGEFDLIISNPDSVEDYIKK